MKKIKQLVTTSLGRALLGVVLVIIGGIVFRFVMVEAGQITRYLY